MRIAIISDIHGNLPALSSCLEILLSDERIDSIYCLGDMVGYFPDVNQVIGLLQLNNVKCLLGNHDAMLLGVLPLDELKDEVYKISISRQNIKTVNMMFLSSLLPFERQQFGDTKVLMVHGSPYNPLLGYVYPDTKIEFDNLGYDFIFMGHTHRPFLRNSERCTIVNVGSCGLPRDIGNLGSYAIWDSELKEVVIKRFDLGVSEIITKYHDAHPKTLECLHRK